MGFFDMLEAALPWSTAEAEAPKEEEKVCGSFSLLLGGLRWSLEGERIASMGLIGMGTLGAL
jgi:hypothetical protein